MATDAMKHGPITDPELLGLLREIASDPRSRLMKLATQGIDRRINLHEPPISEGEPFLTRAERHLLGEYRQQVGRWLYEAAKRAYLLSPQEKTGAYRGPHARWGPLRSLEDLGAERQLLRDLVPFDEEARTVVAGVSVAPGDGRTLGLASLRLVPRDSARNLVGLTCFQAGDRTEGNRLLAEVLHHRPSHWYKSVTLQNVAYGLVEEGRLEEARPLYASAHQAEEARPEPLLGLLSTCLLSGDEHGVQHAATRLSELPGDLVEPCVKEHLEIALIRRAVGKALRAVDAGWIRRVGHELPRIAGTVAFAYARREGES